MTDTFSFEQAFTSLERVLEKMNSTAISLDESLKLFEEGEKLIHTCAKHLNSAEKKIEMLVKNREGDLSLSNEHTPLTQDFPSRDS